MKRSEDIKRGNLHRVRAHVWECLDSGFDSLFSKELVEACVNWKNDCFYYREASWNRRPYPGQSPESLAACKAEIPAKYAKYKASRDAFDAILMRD